MSARFLIVFLLGVVSGSPAFSQAKKGFKLLKAGQAQAALIAFQKETTHPAKQLAAEYGRIAVRSQSTNLDTLLSLPAAWQAADHKFDELTSKQHQLVRKQGFTKRVEGTFRSSLVSRSLAAFDQRPGLDQLQAFEAIYPQKSWEKFSSKNQDRIQRIRSEVIQSSLKDRLNYQALTYLVHFHQDIIQEQSLSYYDRLDDRLFSTFVDEHGWESLNQFREDHPGHWFSSDCWLDEFVEAAKDGSPEALLSFVEAHPLSMAENQARILAKGKIHTSRSEEENASIAAIFARQLTWERMRDEVLEDSLPEDYLEGLLSFLEEEAPRRSAYILTELSLQSFLSEKRWEEAEALMTTAAPWFPDGQPAGCEERYFYYQEKQDWFAGVQEILDRPVEGTLYRSIEELNTEENELAPVASSDGQTLYFARTNVLGLRSGEDLVVSSRVGGKWSAPSLVSSLSSEGNEAPLALTADGRTMLLFRDGRLYLSQFRRGKWQEPDTLAGDWDGLRWIGKATLSADGSILLLEGSTEHWRTSKRINTDLYICGLGKNGSWSKPRKLPAPINTARRERSPFLHTDGKTLYFSSDGHVGLGRMDMFKTTRLGDGWDEWSKPLNLGKELNTVEDDWGLMLQIAPNGRTSYFSSYVNGGDQNNLFMSDLPKLARAEKRVVLTGQLQDDSGKALRGAVEFVDSTGHVIARIRTDEQGRYTLPLVPGMKLVARSASKRLFPISQPIFVPNVDSVEVLETIIQTVPVKQLLAEQKSIPLNTLLFAKNDSSLQAGSFAELDHFRRFLGNRQVPLQLIGHSDNTGSEAHNYQLSLARAEAVRAYFVSKAYPKELITCLGKGHTEPIADNETEEGRAKNRRVEVKFGGK